MLRLFSGDRLHAGGDYGVITEGLAMLDRANSGEAPEANILRAIRHAVAASACRAVVRAGGDVRWERTAVEQSRLATKRLHQATCSRIGLSLTDGRDARS